MAGDNASLGNTTKTASLPGSNHEKMMIVKRYWMQNLARELMPNHRVHICCRFFSHDAQEIKVVFRPTKKTANFKGLARCASIWICPVCGSVISEKRKSELKRATVAHTGDILMVSYTMRHNRSEDLGDLLTALKAAFRDFMAGSYGEDFRRNYGVVGSVRALEITHGSNGWHPHIHQMVFCSKLSDERVANVELELKRRWITHLRKQGRDATNANGLDVKKDSDFIAQYISKFGHMPTQSAWGFEHELSKTVSKKGRNGGRSPLQLLEDYGEGDKQAGELFKIYGLNTVGEKQLIWSRGLREKLGIDVESDEDVMEKEEKDGNFRVLAVLDGYEWSVVRKRKLQPFLLVLAMDGDASKVEQYLIDQKIRGVKRVEE